MADTQQFEKAVHPISKEGKEFLASLGERERKLHEMAMEKLGSSYFVERTHAFRKWAAAAATAKAPNQTQ